MQSFECRRSATNGASWSGACCESIYQSLPSFSDFGTGWLARTKRVRASAYQLAAWRPDRNGTGVGAPQLGLCRTILAGPTQWF